ncbi:hypothetical protein [Sinorhizobium meliloti]|uniref:hypothetical protein n=1 Tax=Rhizobium meliloti TaxID=382 RepID=UPI0013E2DAE5|nr:hypothetical protein [Sinorhizobium meliloti]
MRSGFPSGISKAKGLGIQGKAEMLQHAPAPSLAFPGISQIAIIRKGDELISSAAWIAPPEYANGCAGCRAGFSEIRASRPETFRGTADPL